MKGLLSVRKSLIFMFGITLIIVMSFYGHSYVAGKNKYWPTKEWKTSTPEEQGVDSLELSKFVNELQGKNVHSYLVIKEGYIIAEGYNANNDATIKQNVLSVTKSVTSALVGIAIKQHKIQNVEENIRDYFPQLLQESDVLKKEITIKNLLTMTSGLQWNNDKEVSSNNMISSVNWVQYLLGLPPSSEPGTQFIYSNGGPHLLSALLQKATSKNELDYAKEVLFRPLGIKDIAWDTDPQGISIGSFGLHLTTRDMAKFGFLYLNEGQWGNREIVSKEWVKESTQRAIEFKDNDIHSSEEAYGYLWWLHSTKNAKDNDELSDIYAANGSGGQSIIVMPRQDMIVVLTANNKDSFFSDPIIERNLIPAIKSDKPLPRNLDGEKLLAKKTEEFKQEKDKL